MENAWAQRDCADRPLFRPELLVGPRCAILACRREDTLMAGVITYAVGQVTGTGRILLEHKVDIPALRGVLLRVSRLTDDLPEVTELDFNPVMARPDGAVAVDARIRVTSHRLADPFLRQLPQ